MKRFIFSVLTIIVLFSGCSTSPMDKAVRAIDKATYKMERAQSSDEIEEIYNQANADVKDILGIDMGNPDLSVFFQTYAQYPEGDWDRLNDAYGRLGEAMLKRAIYVASSQDKNAI